MGKVLSISHILRKSLMFSFRNLGMKQKYVSDPFVRISLRSKQEGLYQTRRKSDGANMKELKRTSVRKNVLGFAAKHK